MALLVLLRIGAAVLNRDAPAAATPVPVPAGSHWIATWGAAPQAATAGNLSRAGFRDATIREIVLTSAGGARIRVRLTNAFGSAPLRIGEAAVAVEGSGPRTVAGTSHPLYFAGRRSVVIPPRAEATSDPVPLAIAPATRLAVSIYLPRATGPATEHADAQQVNFVAAGAHVDGAPSAFRIRTQSWYFLDGVDVLGSRRTRSARSSRSATRSRTASVPRSARTSAGRTISPTGSTTWAPRRSPSSTKGSAGTAS